MKTSFNTNQKGFTLVELLVSLSLFIVIVIALVGSLYTVNDASRKVQAMRTVMDNLNFAIESMSRTIRTADHITLSCINGTENCWIDSDGATLMNMDSTLGAAEHIEYRVHKDPVTSRGSIAKRVTPLDDNGDLIMAQRGDWQDITSSEIDIEKAAFYIKGGATTDMMQPMVLVQMEGVATVKGTLTIPFSVQTLLSQRTPESTS